LGKTAKPVGKPARRRVISDIGVNPKTNRIYVRTGIHAVSVIDALSNLVVYTISVGGGGNPPGIGVNPITSRIYVSNDFDNTVSVIEDPEISVPIASERNDNINLHGQIQLSILSTSTFDASTINPSTVLFGKTGTEASAEHFMLRDVNRDGKIDMRLRFDTKKTGIQYGDTQAILTGETNGGQQPLKGFDSITVVGCKK